MGILSSTGRNLFQRFEPSRAWLFLTSCSACGLSRAQPMNIYHFHLTSSNVQLQDPIQFHSASANENILACLHRRKLS